MFPSNKPKLKMQNVSFRNIDEFLEFLPEDEFQLVAFLRILIFNCIPDVNEKLCYNVPFYKGNKNICFIWPASVLWGKTKSYEGVRLGFTNGYLLTDEIGYLEKGNRKQVYMKDYRKLADINTDLLKSYLLEAALIDEKYIK